MWELSFYNVSVSSAMGLVLNGTLPVVPTVHLKTIIYNISETRRKATYYIVNVGRIHPIRWKQMGFLLPPKIKDNRNGIIA